MIQYADFLIWGIPFIIAVISPFLAKLSRKLVGPISIVGIGLSCIMALSMIEDALAGHVIYEPMGTILGRMPFDHEVSWINLTSVANFELKLGILIDPLSIFMANVVSFVALWIFIFSLGYMRDEPDIGRYWFWMNMFAGAMLLLVVSNNLVQMFIAWEMVGLCSWALISFWYKSTAPSPDPSFATEGEYNAHCGFKALVMTSFADVFFLIAILIVGWATWQVYGYPEFRFTALQSDPNFSWVGKIAQLGIIPIFTLFILSGPFGKSAQFPYHEWLPEAMAGPTTVSALIHAATMVKAGVYFVARFFPIMLYASDIYPAVKMFFIVVAYVGGFTAFLAATQGMVAKELKKILAYSTISQLGYMFLGLGIAGLILEHAHAYLYALFHLASHAVFKALLFLSAGAILHAVHTKYIHEMGGLRKYMPVTFWMMLVGALSLVGIPPFSGAFSKEGIIAYAYESGNMILYGLAVITVALTAFYTFRMIGYVFFGEESPHVREIVSKHGIHEAEPVMLIPLVVLAFISSIIGFFGPYIFMFLTGEGAWLHEETRMINIVEYLLEHATSLTFYISLLLILIGMYPSYIAFISRKVDPSKILERNIILRGIYKFFYNRWYINAIYYRVFLGGIKKLSSGLRRIQTGISNVNIAYAILGILIIILLIVL